MVRDENQIRMNWIGGGSGCGGGGGDGSGGGSGGGGEYTYPRGQALKESTQTLPSGRSGVISREDQ